MQSSQILIVRPRDELYGIPSEHWFFSLSNLETRVARKHRPLNLVLHSLLELSTGEMKKITRGWPRKNSSGSSYSWRHCYYGGARNRKQGEDDWGFRRKSSYEYQPRTPSNKKWCWPLLPDILWSRWSLTDTCDDSHYEAQTISSILYVSNFFEISFLVA